ncbi:MAG TPA: hypothetical protein VFS67_21755 [Polyangiaceae bacterium]|nr:hypothetical protein [Polyangiaceae bacterium]
MPAKTQQKPAKKKKRYWARTPKGQAQREDATVVSDVSVILRVTPGERSEAQQLARYLRETLAGMTRRLWQEELLRATERGFRLVKK